MKAEKEMNWSPSKDWNVYVILGRGRHTYLYTGVYRSRADQVVKAFNSSLSAHVAKETASKDKQIEIQQAHIDEQDQLIFDQTKEIAELKQRISVIKEKLPDNKIRDLNPIWVRDEIISELEKLI